MKRIAIRYKRHVINWALVDDKDYEQLASKRWRLDGDGYAMRAEGTAPDSRRILMHRHILQAPANMICDHRDQNRLNNQRSNIRLATRAQNNSNVGPRRTNKLHLKGVRRVKDRYVAEVRFDKKSLRIGTFGTAGEAAAAFDSVSQQLRGDFARLNN